MAKNEEGWLCLKFIFMFFGVRWPSTDHPRSLKWFTSHLTSQNSLFGAKNDVFKQLQQKWRKLTMPKIHCYVFWGHLDIIMTFKWIYLWWRAILTHSAVQANTNSNRNQGASPLTQNKPSRALGHQSIQATNWVRNNLRVGRDLSLLLEPGNNWVRYVHQALTWRLQRQRPSQHPWMLGSQCQELHWTHLMAN